MASSRTSDVVNQAMIGTTENKQKGIEEKQYLPSPQRSQSYGDDDNEEADESRSWSEELKDIQEDSNNRNMRWRRKEVIRG